MYFVSDAGGGWNVRVRLQAKAGGAMGCAIATTLGMMLQTARQLLSGTLTHLRTGSHMLSYRGVGARNLLRTVLYIVHRRPDALRVASPAKGLLRSEM